MKKGKEETISSSSSSDSESSSGKGKEKEEVILDKAKINGDENKKSEKTFQKHPEIQIMEPPIVQESNPELYKKIQKIANDFRDPFKVILSKAIPEAEICYPVFVNAVYPLSKDNYSLFVNLYNFIHYSDANMTWITTKVKNEISMVIIKGLEKDHATIGYRNTIKMTEAPEMRMIVFLHPGQKFEMIYDVDSFISNRLKPTKKKKNVLMRKETEEEYSHDKGGTSCIIF